MQVRVLNTYSVKRKNSFDLNVKAKNTVVNAFNAVVNAAVSLVGTPNYYFA